MATFADSLKREIARVARKELKNELTSLRKMTAGHRSEIAALKRDLKHLQSESKGLARQVKAAGTVASTAAVRTSKDAEPRVKPGRKVVYSAEAFAAMRAKLGITQAQMATLLGVSSLSVYKWESGQVEPREKQKAKVLALRGVGKREVARMLESST